MPKGSPTQMCEPVWFIGFLTFWTVPCCSVVLTNGFSTASRREDEIRNESLCSSLSKLQSDPWVVWTNTPRCNSDDCSDLAGSRTRVARMAKRCTALFPTSRCIWILCAKPEPLSRISCMSRTKDLLKARVNVCANIRSYLFGAVRKFNRGRMAPSGARPSTGPEKRSAPRASQQLVGAVASCWRPPARSLRGRDRRG